MRVIIIILKLYKVVYSCISWSWMQPGFTLLFSWENCHFASLYLNWDVLRLGQIQDFTEGGSIVGPLKAVPCRWVRGHPRKFKSSEMRFPMFWGQAMVFWGLVFLSQNVILINILQFLWRQQFQFRGFDRTPRTPISVSSGGVMRGRLSVKHKIIILICLYVQLSWSINFVMSQARDALLPLAILPTTRPGSPAFAGIASPLSSRSNSPVTGWNLTKQ